MRHLQSAFKRRKNCTNRCGVFFAEASDALVAGAKGNMLPFDISATDEEHLSKWKRSGSPKG